MVLVQLAQTTPAYTQHNVKMFGSVKIKILDVSYMDSGSGTHSIIKMSSSVFNTRNSSSYGLPGGFVAVNNAVLFSNKGDHKQFTTAEPLEFEAVVNGYIDITLTQWDNTDVSNFQGMVLTMDIVPILKETDQEGLRYNAVKYKANLSSI